MGGAEIRISDPVVAFRETVSQMSDHIVMSKSPNKHNRWVHQSDVAAADACASSTGVGALPLSIAMPVPCGSANIQAEHRAKTQPPKGMSRWVTWGTGAPGVQHLGSSTAAAVCTTLWRSCLPHPRAQRNSLRLLLHGPCSRAARTERPQCACQFAWHSAQCFLCPAGCTSRAGPWRTAWLRPSTRAAWDPVTSPRSGARS